MDLLDMNIIPDRLTAIQIMNDARSTASKFFGFCLGIFEWAKVLFQRQVKITNTCWHTAGGGGFTGDCRFFSITLWKISLHPLYTVLG